MLYNNDCRIISQKMEISPRNINFLQNFSWRNFLRNIKSLCSDKKKKTKTKKKKKKTHKKMIYIWKMLNCKSYGNDSLL